MQKRINITVNDDLLQKIDGFAQKNGLSRSAFLGLAAIQYINSLEAAPAVTEMLRTLASLSNVPPSDPRMGETLDAVQAQYDSMKDKMPNLLQTDADRAAARKL